MTVLGCKPGDGGDAQPTQLSGETPSPENSAPPSDPKAVAPLEPAGGAPAARDVLLTASDGVSVYGAFDPALATDADKAAPIVLLFHQAGSNRGEYEPTIAWLNSLGYATLSIDQRSGGTMWDRDNQTVLAHGESTSFDAAYPDIEAALSWAQAQGHDKILAVGSSYTAALVFRLATDHPDDLRGIAAFSPGEYLDDPEQVARWAKTTQVPTYATSSPEEYGDVRLLMKNVPATQKLMHRPTKGVHGASALRPDTNPEGYEEYKTMFKEFLETVL